MSNVNELGHTYYPKMIYRKDGSFKIVASAEEEAATLDEIKKLEKSSKEKPDNSPPWPGK